VKWKNIFWEWPDGLIWKITEKPTLKSRRQKYDLFISLVQPKPEDKILDVGVSPFFGRGTNFLELLYPYPENITALTNEEPGKFKDFNKNYPKVKLIFGDGKNLDFPDDYFDIVFCNAVVEPVGEYQEQKKFIYEICRVGKKIFVTTPNYWFPLDAHTLIPFAHWLPQKIKRKIYKMFGREYWADINHLNLLSEKKFVSLFPEGIDIKLYKQKIFGITSNFIAVVEK